jgi:hypothetical protein
MRVQPTTYLRTALGLGIACSVAVNLLEAQSSIIAKFVAVIAPVMLFLAIEVIAHVETGKWEKLAVGLVGASAGWISYWHMVELAERYGERTDSAHLYAVTVDGMMLAATLALVGAKRREAEARAAAERHAETDRLNAEAAAHKASMEAQRAAQEEEAARWQQLSPKEKAIELLKRDARTTNKAIATVVGLSDVRVGQIRREMGLAPSGAKR